MRFDVKEIGDDGLTVDVPITEPWLVESLPELEARPSPAGLSFHGTLRMSGKDILLLGQLRGRLGATCARCLEPAEVPVDVPIAVTFVEAEAGSEDAPVEDAGVAVFSDDEVDLGPVLRDELVLALPINPVCGEDCKGLCPVCGGNRNQVPCGCEEAARGQGTAWKALADLKLRS